MNRHFSGILSFSIIAGYVMIIISLFWFLTLNSQTSINVISDQGRLMKYVVDPYRNYVAVSGVIYTMIFGVAGSIFMYVFILSPIIGAAAKNTEAYAGGGSLTQKMDKETSEEASMDNRYDEANKFLVMGDSILHVDKVRNFVHRFPEIALMFVLRKDENGHDLDQFTSQTFMNWEINGLNKHALEEEILSILNTGYLGSNIDFQKTVEKMKERIESEKNMF